MIHPTKLLSFLLLAGLLPKIHAQTEQPLFTITHDNHQQYQQQLTAGQIALFNTYSDSFKMPVYASRKSHKEPDWVTANTQTNIKTAKLNEAGTGFTGAHAGIPFAEPESALEVYFNHIARWRGKQLVSHASDANVGEDGDFQLTSRESLIRFDYYLENNDNPNRLFSALSKITAPATKAGSGGLVLEPIDQIEEARNAWLWDKGRRRVVRAPNVAYDQPVNSASGLRTADDTDIINGSPDRFDWQLLEQREIYIPYNNQKLASKQLSYTDILKAGHINPEHTRYELHKVWVIRATLKSEWRHLYSQRDFYIDADSWSAVIADQYDKQGQLFRVSLSYLNQDDNLPGTFPVINVYHDLNSKRYHVMGLQNESNKSNDYNSELAKSNMFTSNGLKRFVK
ncbi:MAG: DUF1329 domain-containing protein [Marinicella sp.]